MNRISLSNGFVSLRILRKTLNLSDISACIVGLTGLYDDNDIKILLLLGLAFLMELSPYGQAFLSNHLLK